MEEVGFGGWMGYCDGLNLDVGFCGCYGGVLLWVGVVLWIVYFELR